jgi:peptide/nickel transport system substrate-binding protein
MTGIRRIAPPTVAVGLSALLLWASLSTAACRHRSDTPRDEGSTILRVGLGMGPSGRYEGLDVLTELLYSEPLVGHDWTGRPIPALADAPQWDDTRTTVRLTLKPNIKFHNGSLLTADTVVRFLNLKRKNRLGFVYVTDVTAENATTIVIRLSRPDAFLLPNLTDLRITYPDAPDISTGPFRLVSRTPVVQAIRFDDYHGGKSPLNGVRIVTYDSHRSAWAALMRKEVDVVQEVSRESVEFMEHARSVKTYGALQSFYIFLGLNQRHPALRQVEVRRAIAQALDRQAIIDRALRGKGHVAEGPVWLHHWAYRPPTSTDGFNPEAARRRLDAAGFPMRAATSAGERRSRFTLKCLVWSEEPQYERIAQMVQRQLFDVGINLEIDLLPLKPLIARAQSGDFDTYLLQANAGRAIDYTYRFWRSSGAANQATQQSGYSGADGALDRLRHSRSDEETRAAVADVVQRFHDDAPAAFIAWLEVTRAVDTHFSVVEDQSTDPFLQMWQWRPVSEPAK